MMSSALTRKRKRPKHSLSVLPVEEADQRGNAEGGGGGGVALKKGPWTKEEDEILVDHIKKYGEGNWKAVQKNSGLARDGKSCRLRWLNNLRSGLKKGPFTAEEERIMLEFRYLKGSKWAQMASLLPGRTDNEIKNFWHTRSRKREQAGLPIYPDEISSKCSLIGSQEIDDMLANEFSRPDETENFNLDITDLDLKDFKFRPDMLPSYFDSKDCKLISDLVGWRSDLSHNTISTRPSKCPRVSVVPHRYLIGSSNDAVPVVIDQYRQYPMKSTPCDPILNTNLHHGYDNPSTGFHVTPNISSPQPIYGSMRLEPPSFQNLQTQPCSRSGMYVPQNPTFESVDTPVQAPLIEPVDTLVQAPLIEPVDTPVQAPLTQWNGLDDDHGANYDIYGGALNQLPAYSSFDKEDSLNQIDLALPDVVLDSGWH
ncbi:transcription factor GAMYB-like [Vicia villosa]|uniref:transcription factor GAMYB-like n=1 Tax=Vicia villosa TaxID=3911 RepID=UPI00273B7DD7|nr:transcription factor GAMYB-like [Vicia villosa]